MTFYQVMVEGVFVHAPALGEELGGFHTTFFLKANNASSAANRVRSLLADRLHDHGVTMEGEGLLKTYYFVHDIWEITEERLSRSEHTDSGFTFFRIGRMERFHLALRRLYMKRRKPWLLIGCPSVPVQD